MFAHFNHVSLTETGLCVTFFADQEPLELSAWDTLRLRKQLQPLEAALLEIMRREQKQLEKGSAIPHDATDLRTG